MDKLLVWSAVDNSTDALENAPSSDATFNSTVALSTTPMSLARKSLPLALIAGVVLIISSVGICANSVVLAVLIRARRQFGSSVHTLIANQSAIDLFACAAAVLSAVFMLTHGYKNNGKGVIDDAICAVFDNATLASVGLTAGNIGLVVITLERYFKIVHAIAHRKYYKPWMTSVGVALPWIGGTCLILFPAICTSRIVNGICGRMNVWPNQAMAFVSLHLYLMLSLMLVIGDFVIQHRLIDKNESVIQREAQFNYSHHRLSQPQA